MTADSGTGHRGGPPPPRRQDPSGPEGVPLADRRSAYSTIRTGGPRSNRCREITGAVEREPRRYLPGGERADARRTREAILAAAARSRPSCCRRSRAAPDATTPTSATCRPNEASAASSSPMARWCSIATASPAKSGISRSPEAPADGYRLGVGHSAQRAGEPTSTRTGARDGPPERHDSSPLSETAPAARVIVLTADSAPTTLRRRTSQRRTIGPLKSL